jgi:ABC-type transport system involved in multi-copper enzyme maturation permease subunit
LTAVSADAGTRRGARRLRGSRSGVLTGIAAVGAKEVRGRMRGRRAFVIVTIYLLLLALFAWGIYQFKLSYPGDIFAAGGIVGGGQTPSAVQAATRSAEIGHALFAGLLMLLTVLVLVLAPALTSGAISQEREKQTLDMLVATPLSTTGMVISKLVSALVYLLLLIVASIPVASVVFTFGGVGPEDVVRAYTLLFAVSFGVGAIGLFFSAVARRTQVATVLSYITVLALTMGSLMVWVFWFGVSTAGPTRFVDGRFERQLPPQQVLWLNPFVADLDVLCGAGLSKSCQFVGEVTNRPWFGTFTTGIAQPAAIDAPRERAAEVAPDAKPLVGAGGDLPVGGDVQCVRAPCPGDGPAGAAVVDPGESIFTQPRDLMWPQVAGTFVGLGLILMLLSAQLVAPSRRLPFAGRALRRPHARAASGTVLDAGTGAPPTASAGAAAAFDVAPVEPSHQTEPDVRAEETTR